MSGRTVISPSMRRGARRWRRRFNGDGIVAAVRRTETKKMRPTARSTESRPDCAEEEEAEDEAVLLVQFDLLLAVCNVGGERRRLGQRTAMARSI